MGRRRARQTRIGRHLSTQAATYLGESTIVADPPLDGGRRLLGMHAMLAEVPGGLFCAGSGLDRGNTAYSSSMNHAAKTRHRE